MEFLKDDWNSSMWIISFLFLISSSSPLFKWQVILSHVLTVEVQQNYRYYWKKWLGVRFSFMWGKTLPLSSSQILAWNVIFEEIENKSCLMWLALFISSGFLRLYHCHAIRVVTFQTDFLPEMLHLAQLWAIDLASVKVVNENTVLAWPGPVVVVLYGINTLMMIRGHIQ